MRALAWRFEAAIVLAGLSAVPACGGNGEVAPPPRMDATSPPSDAGPESEAKASVLPADDAGGDGCACNDATTDGDVVLVDSPVALDGPDADAMPPFNDICHAFWPQPPHLVVNGSQIAADLQGNAYFAMTYHGETTSGPTPTIDLGVADAGSYPVGVAIAKVDPACHLLWVREIGDAEIGSVENHQIVVDSQSNVSIAGLLAGSVEVGGTTLRSPDAGGA
ncbi:MAG: hypothetical protein ACRENE_26670, partial [Polyangiaceae bacterium]